MKRVAIVVALLLLTGCSVQRSYRIEESKTPKPGYHICIEHWTDRMFGLPIWQGERRC